MTHTYNITGMTCNGCVAKAKSTLLKIGDITEAFVQLTSPQATITMQKHIPVTFLQNALHTAGDYVITEADGGMHHSPDVETKTWIETYKPILLIFFYITLVAIITAVSATGFDGMVGMRVFMSGFFLVFSFFKMLDLKGFAKSYAMYDIVAKKWSAWGYIYVFIELGLGLAYAMNFNPLVTNVITLIVMTISIIGVLQIVLNNKKIQCACLGAVFNLPMSTVTIIEDGLMIAMSAIMLAVAA